MKQTSLKFSFMFLILQTLRTSTALRCYSCSITSGNTDMKCLHDPMSVEGQSVVNCNRKYCTIFRQELKDPAGKINSFVRGCEEKPVFLDEVIDDPMFRTFYRSCTEDLCNDGDALKSSTEQKISSDGFDGENLLVPGLPLSNSGLASVHIKLMIISVIAANLVYFCY